MEVMAVVILHGASAPLALPQLASSPSEGLAWSRVGDLRRMCLHTALATQRTL